MKQKLKFEIGQTVFLKSDITGAYPMTILEIEENSFDTGSGCHVCWFNKSGRMLYNTIPEDALRESLAIK